MAKKLADKVTQEELVMALRIKEAFKDAFNGDDFMTNDFLKNLRDEVDTSPKNGTLDNIEIKALGMVLGNIANHLPEDGEKRKFIKKSLHALGNFPVPDGNMVKGTFVLGLKLSDENLEIFSNSIAKEIASPTLPIGKPNRKSSEVQI